MDGCGLCARLPLLAACVALFASHLIGVRLYHVIRDILPYFLITLLSLSCAWWSLSSREYLYTVCFEDYCVCDFIHWNYVGCEVL